MWPVVIVSAIVVVAHLAMRQGFASDAGHGLYAGVTDLLLPFCVLYLVYGAIIVVSRTILTIHSACTRTRRQS